MAIPTAAAGPPAVARSRTRAGVHGLSPVRGVVVTSVLASTVLIAAGPRGLVLSGREAVSVWLGGHVVLDRLVGVVGLQTAGNVLLFVPLGAAAAWCVPWRRMAAASAAVALLPLLVEVAQVALPGRVPDGLDAVRNSTGALVCLSATVGARWAYRSIRKRHACLLRARSR